MSMEQLLTQAANDLSIRSQVEETLTSILHDVEAAHTLQQSLNAHNALHDLKEKYATLRLRYEEREALWELERKEKEKLGVALLEEIVKLSARGVREEKERSAMEMQLERLTEEVKRGAADTKTTDAEKQKDEIKDGSNPEATEDTKDKNLAEDIAQVSDDTPKESISEKVKDEPVEPIREDTTTQEHKISPHELNETILMNIFSFTDPLDIMNFAQINKAMFTRIDTLFGMGSSAVSSDDGTAAEVQASTVPNNQPPPPSSVAPAPVAPSSASVASGNSVQSAGTAPKSSPKLFAMPAPSIPPIVGPATGSSWLPRFGATADSASAASASQPAVPAPTHSRTPSSGSVSSTPGPAPDTEIKLNAAMASSMASKLTPAELSIILRMREKLQKCEADAARWRKEKEEAVGNLASVEAVKDFLVTKVRDTEKIVETQKEEMKEVQRKNLADQEVIVFLDERVKKLESEVGDIKSKEENAKQDAADVVAKNEKKVRVLSDMLRFEREQMVSNEKEWKNTKKLLVKEVKSCRSHIVTLEAELEGLRRQNEQLKEGMKASIPPKKGLKLR